MSSIDERIVEMKFNNTQFEAGIKTTMSSLDGLKKSLKFDAAIKSLSDLGTASNKVKLKINTDGVSASVKSVQTASSNITKSLGDIDKAGRVAIKLDAKGFQDGARAVMDAAKNIQQNLSFSSVGQAFKDFDYRGFASNVTSTVKGAINSFSELDLATNKISFNSIADNLDSLRGKFEGLSVVGIAALATIGAKAATVGIGLAKSLFIDNPKMGLEEYETNLNSIQTILANTQSKGSTLGDVNGALAELNEYSDKTIYNFSEMARNIGTFTAAGVDLDTSTNAIKGISNLAAMSGSNSQQASTAMYQLSQAMSTGKVSLMDWNSVVNAGMGGEAFQTAIKETARNQGIAVDGIIKKNGSFRDSLQEGWLTTEVMTETLSKLTGDLTDDQLKTMGYTKDQIKGIQEMAKTANDAATKVKTFTQLVGTLQESTASGWATSMQLILGDFEEAKKMWTNVNDVLGGMVKAGSDRRNKMLGDWNELGGREAMIQAVANAFKALMGVIKPVTDAFRKVFPPTTGKQLYDITVAIRNFTAALVPGAATTSILYNTFRLLFTIIKIGVTIVGGFLRVIGALFGAIFLGGEGVSNAGKSIGDFIGTIADAIGNSKAIPMFFDALVKGATMVGTAIGVAMTFLAPFIQQGLGGLGTGLKTVIGFLGMFGSAVAAGIGGFLSGGLESALTRVRERLESFGRLGGFLGDVWNNIAAGAKALWKDLEPLVTALGDMFKDIGKEIKTALEDVNFNDVLDIVNVGLLGGLVLMFRNFFKNGLGIGGELKDGILSKLSDSLGGIKDVLGALTGTLEAMQNNLQADTLMKIALAIGILTASVVVLSLIDSGKLTKALIGIGVMVVILNKAMAGLDALTQGTGFAKLPFIAASMMILAGAIFILAISVKMLSDLSWGELVKGLAGVSVLLYAVAGASQIMAKNPANLIATGLGLIAVAVALKILASAVGDLAALSFGDMIKGLVGVGALLTALSIFTNTVKVNKGAMATGAGLILLGIALKIMASAMADFAAMSVGALIQGFVVLTAVLFVISEFTRATGNNKNVIQTAVSLVILGAAMHIIASALGALGSLSWEVLAKGLLSMAIALKVITTAMSMLPPNMLVNAIGMIAVGAALMIIGQALQAMGGMTWEEIAKGLVTLAGALLFISAGLILMTGTVAGSAALIVAAGALAIMTPVLLALGNMTWEQLLHGIAGLAAVFIIFGLAGLVLTPVVPTLLALGIAIGQLGLGLLSAGAGTLMFVVALVALAAGIAVIAPAITLLVTTILDLIPLAMRKLGEGIVEFANVLKNAAPVFLNAMVILITTLLKAIQILAPKIGATLLTLITTLLNLLVRAVPKFVDAGMKIILGILTGIGKNIRQVVTAATTVITEFLGGISQNLPRITNAAADLIISFVRSLADTVRARSGEMNSAGLDLAQAIIEGMVSGISAGIGRVADAARNIASSALDTVKGWLGIASPSKEFTKIGAWSSEGLAVGILSYSKMVTKAAGAIGQAAIDGTTDALDINSPSKEMEKLGKFTMQGFVKGLTGTNAQSKAAFVQMRDLLNETIKSSKEDIKIAQDKLAKLRQSRKDDLTSLKKAEKDKEKILAYNRKNGKKKDKSTDAVNARIKKLKKSRATELKLIRTQEKALSTSISENKKATQGRTVLYKKLEDDAVKLQKYAAQTDALAVKITNAKKKLSDAVKTRDDYKSSIRSQYSTLESIDENTRTKTYFKNMEQQIKETQEFATKIQQLRKLGLNDTLYKELLAKGPDSMPFVKELVAGGKSKVAEFNGLQRKLDSEALKLGSTSAGNLYQAGVNAAAGLVKGLEKQQKNIERQMDKIAGYMLRSIKRALGIKSPSREFAKVGKWSTEGLVKGLDQTSKAAAKSAEGVGISTLESLRKSMTNMGTIVPDELGIAPTIRPVLDLSAIKKDANRIPGMLATNALAISANYDKAKTLSAIFKESHEAAASADQNSSESAAGKSVTFNQYNNSPKALSQGEIYRNTKNQLSVAKGALTP